MGKDTPRFVPLEEKKRHELDRYLKTSSTRSLIARFMILQIIALEKIKYEKEVGDFPGWSGISAKQIFRQISRTFQDKISLHTIYKHINNMTHLSWVQRDVERWVLTRRKMDDTPVGSWAQPLPGWVMLNTLTFQGEKELERIKILLGRRGKLPASRQNNPYGDLLHLS